MTELLVFLVGLVSVLRAAIKSDVNVKDLVFQKMEDYVTKHGTKVAYKSEYFRTSRGVDTPFVSDSEIYTFCHIGKLDAVRDYRNRTALSLMDSKVSIEEQMEKGGYTAFRRY